MQTMQGAEHCAENIGKYIKDGEAIASKRN